MLYYASLAYCLPVCVMQKVCFSVLRDRLLPRWIKVISKTRVTVNMYEEQSFLRDPALIQFVFQILDSLKEFDIVLEASLIKGVNL
jgi:DENN domain-containing protein 5